MNSFIKYHLNKYSQMTTQDIVKMLYQNHFGPGHFIKDLDFVNKYYYNELNNSQDNENDNLYEHIGNNFIRINIHKYKKLINSNNNNIINMFYNSSLIDYNNKELVDSFKQQLLKIKNDGFLDNYDFSNVHHSKIYNELYNPHYRVVSTKYLDLNLRIHQLQHYLDNIKEFSIIALEGKCASGKSTISNNLKNVTIIDVDEFFLRQELKTKERLEEIGGNIDYDLYEQCLKTIKPNSTITYTIFDCQTQTYKQKTIEIKDKVLLVGVYSYHHKVRKYIDKLAYLLINKDTQLQRLKQRKMYLRFINEWVPMEEKYYNSFDFIGNCDILI